MALTKVGGGIIQQPIDVGIITATSVNASGVITATSFDGNVTGDVTGNVTGNLSGDVTGDVTGNVTGNLTGDVTGNTSGTAGGLTGTPNITVGSVTATTGTFSGNLDVGGVLTYEDVTNVDAVGIVTARIGVKASNIQIGVTGGTEIDTTSGNLTLDSAGGTTTVDDYLTVTGGGNVSAGDWRFTGASNKHVTWDNSEGALEWENNAKATFGTGDALQIYHSGSESVILDAGTGQLNIRTDLLRVNNTNDNETLATFVSDGAVSLYHDNSKKFETSGIGATVYGTLVSDLDLTAIDSTISGTATDVFIYDTSKDSDGGAWRKRTQHTSWYNETLNTATRGSRREFPAVAVIVAQQDYIKIYDGDDPDLPMWMVFNVGSQGMANTPMVQLQGVDKVVYALNGVLATGTRNEGSNYGQPVINFISEKVLRMDSQGGEGGEWMGTIAQRNESNGYRSVDYDYVIAASRVNDIAMTVLPNAPIDDATGLPVPTIAVATDGGVTIIKDDGSVVSKTTTQLNSATLSSNYFHKNIDISGENAVVNYEYTGGGGHGQLMVVTLNDLTVLRRYGRDYANTTSSHPYFQPIGSRHRHFPKQIYKNNYIFTREQNDSAINGDADGILTIYEDQTVPSNGLINRISSSYNTGWMQGDIKGAFLSDTDTTNAVETELHPNGNSDFSSTDVSYISNTASGTATVTNGQLVLSGGTSGYSDHILTVSNLEVGAQYMITIDYVAKSAGAGSIGFYVNGAYLNELNDTSGYIGRSTGKSYTFYFTTAFSSRTIDLVTGGDTSVTHTFDNWSIKKVEEDRSVNNNGLKVFGTVTKSAVATGADLVSYGPFSTSNRLRQPYNSDLNFGTNDFSIIFWMYNTGSTVHQTLVGRDNREFSVDILDNANYNRKFRIYSFDSGNSLQTFDSNNDPFPLNTWSHVCVNYTNGNTAAVYVNGVLNKSGTLNYDIDDTSNGLNIGCRNTSGTYAHAADATKLSLVRISNSAPTAEQVKKMYEDEKMLFQENAKATLYGSSDAVTALAYDDDTDLLHVGTSSGRSDFQGLRRINNTTTAVTTAITAQNEFIIEQ